MTPKKATAPLPFKIRQYKPPLHLRQADIDSQPRPVSMSARSTDKHVGAKSVRKVKRG